jgi:Ca2+-binding EF-hand superfamily protein
LLGLTTPILHGQPPVEESEPPPDSLLILDRNKDGVIDPYEALDALLAMEEELGEPITLAGVAKYLAEDRREDIVEATEMLEAMDTNGDGKTSLDELDENMREFAELFDANDDSFITAEELSATDVGTDDLFMSREEIDLEVRELFEQADGNGDDVLTAAEVGDGEAWGDLVDADSDRDGSVTRDELTVFLVAVNAPAGFRVADGVAVMSGVIDSETPARVLRLVFEHPDVRTIEMTFVPGSIDDEANLRAAAVVRRFGFTTLLRRQSTIASGGTDFFLAGKQRVVEAGALLGIHSWGGPGFEGQDVPRDDPQHRLYLDYYEEMGIPAEFYWRTLEAAPADGIHWMTEPELERFRFRTEATEASAKEGLR